MMNKKTGCAVLSLILIVLLVSGCSGVLTPENTVLTVEPDVRNSAAITSFTARQGGRVQDLSADGSQVLSIGQTAAGTRSAALDIYDTASESLVNLISSDVEIGSAMFTSKGIYYSRRTVRNQLTDDLYQIMWYSLDKSTERTITVGDQTSTGVFTCWGDDQIAYISSNHNLVLADSQNETERFELDKNLSVKKIAWSPSENALFLLGTTNDGETDDLYKMTINRNGTLDKSRVASHVIDFDYSENSGTVAYIHQELTDQGLYLTTAQTGFAKGYCILRAQLNSVRFTEDGHSVIYTQAVAESNTSNQSIWKTSIDTVSPIQISAPMQLTSNVCSAADQSPVYFSASDSYLGESAPQITSPNLLCVLTYSQENGQ